MNAMDSHQKQQADYALDGSSRSKMPLLVFIILMLLALCLGLWQWQNTQAAQRAWENAANSHRNLVNDLGRWQQQHEHDTTAADPANLVSDWSQALQAAGLPVKAVQQAGLRGGGSSGQLTAQVQLQALRVAEIGAAVRAWQQRNSGWAISSWQLTPTGENDLVNALLVLSSE
jgi:hypothetical protein